jgi:hypothetical protein
MDLFVLFGDGVSPGKKHDGKLHHCAYAWCTISAIFFNFFLMKAPSPNKTNKLIPYHLIKWKHKYYVIKLYVFHDFFLHYILWRWIILWRLSIYVTDRFFFRWHKITSIFQPIEKRVTWKIKWFMIYKTYTIVSTVEFNYSSRSSLGICIRI